MVSTAASSQIAAESTLERRQTRTPTTKRDGSCNAASSALTPFDLLTPNQYATCISPADINHDRRTLG